MSALCHIAVFFTQEKVWTSTDQTDGAEPSDNKPTTGETVVPDAGPPKE